MTKMILALAVVGIVNIGVAVHRPCAVEDSSGPCHWDASQRGNGEGTSFVVLWPDLVVRAGGNPGH